MNKRDSDKFKGCLVGGAAGDALGYAVEFCYLKAIYAEYGEGGIRDYKLRNGKAIISDDTQMTLFTANGLLCGSASEATSGIKADYKAYVWRAYRDWLKTQCGNECVPDPKCSWLLDVPELNERRAPGNTCISAIEGGTGGSIKSPVNDSKGCGGIMRVAPVGLFFIGENYTADEVAMLGAETAALTHGHELGYIPAAALTYVVYALASGGCTNPKDAVVNSLAAVERLFPDAIHSDYFIELINYAIELSETDTSDIEAINKLGAGWVAEETFAIAVYCALKYCNDFEKAIIASVNHSGDSDSTGAVTGNIMGAFLGLNKIPEKFITNLELEPLIEEIAEDLCTGYSDSLKSKYTDCNYEADPYSRK